MYQKHLSGIIEINVVEKNQLAIIPYLYPYQKDGRETTKEQILKIAEEKEIDFGLDEEVIQFYIDFALDRLIIIEKAFIACGKPPIRKALEIPKLDRRSAFSLFEDTKWRALAFYHSTVTTETEVRFPFPVNFYHKGDKIATQTRTEAEEVGHNVHGKEIRPSRTATLNYFAGEGVYFDEATKSYIAGISGYFIINENKLSVKSPYILSSNRMQMFYLNYLKASAFQLQQKEFMAYVQQNGIQEDLIVCDEFSVYPDNEPVLLVEGKQPTLGVDAEVKYHFEIKDSVGTMLEDGSMDFKEKDIYINVEEDDLLATKKLAQRGKNGLNIFGNVVPAKSPRDAVLNHGAGTKVIKSDKEIKVLSDIVGILNFKNDAISIFPTVMIKGDVSYESGNVRSKANVHVTGNLLAGFEINSGQNVTINGTVEDNTTIIAKGNILVKGGIIGENVTIHCGGNLSAKFIEGGSIHCEGNVNVIRFVLETKLECKGAVTILGRGINLRERGAIVDSKIYAQKYLSTPVIGSDAGTKTEIWFAWDPPLVNKIEQLRGTLDKLVKQIEDIKNEFEVDITADNIYTLMKSLEPTVKDSIIEAMQKINAIKKKFTMMNKILEKELVKRNMQLEEATIEVTQKIMPPCIFHCNDVQKTIDKTEPPSKIFFDMDLKIIERKQYVVPK